MRGTKKSQAAKCDISVSHGANANKEDSNFGTKSFYGKKVSKKSGQDVSENGAENVFPVEKQCGNVDINVDINDINNASFADLDVSFGSSVLCQVLLNNQMTVIIVQVVI